MLAYLADTAAHEKRERANHLLCVHADQLTVSAQELFELHNVVIRKLVVSAAVASERVRAIARLRLRQCEGFRFTTLQSSPSIHSHERTLRPLTL